ncbi:hypothetical protein QQ008_03435 [Fulvivirgaceae bacterium BMA10]|uniref:Uncharacterized protein n=1 Tax=Splendidivirga corallicola TaxID=3051826 RepID=A0ABT8KI49_9BACT|nr:hypothetical protein [Fulvivirgaceae bacterium BMA10]
MKTEFYNPSSLEVEFAHALKELKGEIEQHLSAYTITEVEQDIHGDNPRLVFHLLDKEADQHTVVIKLIQRPDN